MVDHTSKKALVVDDEDMIRELVKLLLERMGFWVDLASDGKAIYDLASHKYDIIVTDFMMAGCNGLEGVELAKTFGCNSAIIIMTGLLLDKKEFKKYTLLNKPFSEKDFRKAVEDAFRKKFEESS
jgi:CheY-like chemotaxis protein